MPTGSDGEAEPKVGDAVEVLLNVGCVSHCYSTCWLLLEHAPATTKAAAAGRGAGRPCRAHVGLADQVVDFHRGGLAGQAGKCPATARAAGEDFGLTIRQEFELGHVFVQMNNKGLAQIVSIHDLCRTLLLQQIRFLGEHSGCAFRR